MGLCGDNSVISSKGNIDITLFLCHTIIIITQPMVITSSVGQLLYDINGMLLFYYIYICKMIVVGQCLSKQIIIIIKKSSWFEQKLLDWRERILVWHKPFCVRFCSGHFNWF